MKNQKVIKLIFAILIIGYFGTGLTAATEAPVPVQVMQEAAKVVPSGLSEQVNRIEIKIGNEIITTVEIEVPLQQLQKYLKKNFRGKELQKKIETARSQHIKKLIEGKLLLLEARHQEIDIQDAMVKENAEKEVVKLKAQFPSEEAFRKQLALEHLNEYELIKQREKIVRENLMRQKLLQQKLREFKTGAEVSDDKLKQHYEKNKSDFHSPARAHVRQIFVKRPGTTLPSAEFLEQDNQAKAKIKKALRELERGRPFAAVAKSYSEHRLSSDKGGEIGWVEEGDLGLPEFEKAVFKALAIGGVSGILDTARGYFVVKVIDRQPGKTLPFSEVRGRIRKSFMAEGSEKRYNIWIKSLEEKYKVIYAKN